MTRGTILAVDDEPDILIALEDLFEDTYRVVSTTKPAEALALLAKDPDIAVILSDQRMPGMTGDAMLSEARSFHEAQAILLDPVRGKKIMGEEFAEMAPAGYRLFAVRGPGGRIVAAAGVQVLTNLYYERHLYLYDLVATEDARS